MFLVIGCCFFPELTADISVIVLSVKCYSDINKSFTSTENDVLLFSSTAEQTI